MVGHQRRPSADIIPFHAARRSRAGHAPATSQGVDPQRTDAQAAGAQAAGARAADFPASEPHVTDSNPADAVRGTILLFTGVRYERLPDPAEPGRPAPERRCRG